MKINGFQLFLGCFVLVFAFLFLGAYQSWKKEQNRVYILTCGSSVFNSYGHRWYMESNNAWKSRSYSAGTYVQKPGENCVVTYRDKVESGHD